MINQETLPNALPLNKEGVFFQDIEGLMQAFEKRNPDPRCELDYTNPFTLLVGVVLSAQSTDVGVNKATPALFAKADNPKDLLALGRENLMSLIKTIGLYQRKADYLMKISFMLIKEYNAAVPHTQKELMMLPGIGQKSANVILNVCFHQPKIAVDTHVFRVSRRMGMSKAKTPEKVEEDLEALIPLLWRRKASHWLVLHGRYICKAKRPLCEQCFAKPWCQNPVYT